VGSLGIRARKPYRLCVAALPARSRELYTIPLTKCEKKVEEKFHFVGSSEQHEGMTMIEGSGKCTYWRVLIPTKKKDELAIIWIERK
jgi:hypothetical protein